MKYKLNSKPTGGHHWLAAMVLFAWLVISPSSVRAVTLDWTQLYWAPGTNTMTYYAATATNGTSTNLNYVDSTWAGVGSVTITVTGATNQYFNSTYPQNGTAWSGGATPGNALDLYATFTNINQALTVTVTFNNYSSGVTGLTTTLFDVDRGTLVSSTNYTWVDQIRYIHAGDKGTNNIAPTLTAGLANKVAGSGNTNNAVTGTNAAANNTSDGNVGIDFGTNVVDMFALTYGNASTNVENAPFNTSGQAVGIYNINFTAVGKPKVPEFQPSLAAIAVCGFLMIQQVFARRRLLGRKLPSANLGHGISESISK